MVCTKEQENDLPAPQIGAGVGCPLPWLRGPGRVPAARNLQGAGTRVRLDRQAGAARSTRTQRLPYLTPPSPPANAAGRRSAWRAAACARTVRGRGNKRSVVKWKALCGICAHAAALPSRRRGPRLALPQARGGRSLPQPLSVSRRDLIKRLIHTAPVLGGELGPRKRRLGTQTALLGRPALPGRAARMRDGAPLPPAWVAPATRLHRAAPSNLPHVPAQCRAGSPRAPCAWGRAEAVSHAAPPGLWAREGPQSILSFSGCCWPGSAAPGRRTWLSPAVQRLPRRPHASLGSDRGRAASELGRQR